MNNKKTIELADQFLSKISLNHYLKRPLMALDLNTEELSEYISKENLYIDSNAINPLVSIGKITYIKILLGANKYVKNLNIDENKYYNNLIETVIHVSQNNEQLVFIKEISNICEYNFKTIDEILNCLVLKHYATDLGDQLRLSTFLQVYLCLADKAKAMNGTV